jgi:hypothetical protein
MGISSIGARGKAAALIAAAVAITGTGAAIAASSGALSPREESDALVDATAKNLGVTSAKLTDALQQALSDRVDAQVAAGTLTEAQGAEMKERIASGDFPLLGGGGRGGPGGHHGFADLSAAAGYIGVTEAALRESLESGETLAEVATASDKSVEGLVAALASTAKERIAADVAAGRLTESQSESILADLSDRITDLVNGTMPDRGPGFGPGGPPPGEAATSDAVA